MTFASVLDAAVSLVTTAGTFTTVAKLDDWLQADVPPDSQPAVLFATRERRSLPLSFGHPAKRWDDWDLEAYLWATYNPLSDTEDTFTGLVEAITETLNTSNALAGAGDTARSKVEFLGNDAANGIRTKVYPPVRNGATATRNALIRIRVEELVTP